MRRSAWTRSGSAWPSHRPTSTPRSTSNWASSWVRAITRIATPETEEELIDLAHCALASDVETVVRGYRRAERLQLDRAQRQHQGRYLHPH